MARQGVTAFCAIGDEKVHIKYSGNKNVIEIPYADIVSKAGEYIRTIGGFERFAEWGLIR